MWSNPSAARYYLRRLAMKPWLGAMGFDSPFLA